MLRRALLLLSVTLCAIGGHAQSDPAEYETVLLPVAAYETPGAFGSRWVTHFSIHNGLDRPVKSTNDILMLGVCVSFPCPVVAIEAGRTASPEIHLTYRGELPGVLLYVRRDIADQITFSLRVQDISRQSLTWGTEIPVVRERDLYRRPIRLINIPVDARFRQTLRIYDPLPHIGCRYVRVRLFDPESGTTLLSQDVQLARDADCNQTLGSRSPDAAEWHNLAGLAQVTTGRIGVEVTPLGDFAIWAFVSVTNNETQHVTTITPQ